MQISRTHSMNTGEVGDRVELAIEARGDASTPSELTVATNEA
jgi:hypothetical protein